MKDNSKLFIDTVQFEKTAYKRVGENPSDWTSDVMESFYNQFPFFVNSKVTINFTQRDDSRGYAIGQIAVEEGPGLTIPIIIKDRELYPFDVAIANGNAMPLTNATIQMYVENKGAFWKLVPPDAGDVTNALFNTSFSQSITPTYMHESYKQAEFDTETMAEKNMRTSARQRLGGLNDKEVPPEETTVKRLEDEAIMGGQIKANMTFTQLRIDYDRTHSDSALFILLSFKKCAQENGIKTLTWHVKDITGEGPGTPEVKTDLNDKYRIDPFISRITPTISGSMKLAFFDVLQKDASIVEGFKRNGTSNFILKVAGINPQEVNFKDQVRQELERDIHYIYKSGSHEYTGIFGNSTVADPFRITLDEVQAKSFEPIKVAEFSPTAELHLEKTASIKYAFAVRDRKYVVLENNDFIEFEPGIAAPVEDDSHFKYAIENLVVTKPQVTKYATWITELGFSNPFETLRVWESNGKEYVETWTGLDKKAYCRMKGIDAPFEEDGVTFLPENAKFVKLGNRVEIPERFIDDLIDYKVIKTAENQYHSNFGPTERSGGDADLHETTWNMIQAGARKTDIEKLSNMKDGEVIAIHYNIREPHSLEKIAEIMGKGYEKDADVIIDVAKNFIKEASTFNDSPTVDSILSLNFVNKNNILEFVDALPMFAQTSQKLADMLLKTRLGVSLIDEGAVRRVMLGIVEIMDVLNGVQNLVEKK